MDAASRLPGGPGRCRRHRGGRDVPGRRSAGRSAAAPATTTARTIERPQTRSPRSRRRLPVLQPHQSTRAVRDAAPARRRRRSRLRAGRGCWASRAPSASAEWCSSGRRPRRSRPDRAPCSRATSAGRSRAGTCSMVRPSAVASGAGRLAGPLVFAGDDVGDAGAAQEVGEGLGPGPALRAERACPASGRPSPRGGRRSPPAAPTRRAPIVNSSGNRRAENPRQPGPCEHGTSREHAATTRRGAIIGSRDAGADGGTAAAAGSGTGRGGGGARARSGRTGCARW